MKQKILISTITILIFGFFSCINAQISQGGKPYAFTHQLSSYMEVKIMPPVDVESLLHEDAIARKDVPYRFGYCFDVSYNLQNSGTWEKLSDGGKLWRLKILSQGAYSVNLIYDKFWLPEGAKFFIYNKDRSMTIGAFTSRNNKPYGKFATRLVKGDEIILEYYEPDNISQPGVISISKVIHAYRNIFKYSSNTNLNKVNGFGDSESCNNNVHCPEADDWQNEVHSVAMIILGNSAGSGSLINSVKENYAPFFLTANHVYEANTNVNTWVFYFNYESDSCANPETEPSAQTISGATFKANNSASDFALLMLSETPPLSYNVYFNGWSNINSAASSSVGIHHPSADIKKISYEEDQATSATWPDTPTDSHWSVRFDDGTVEHGSSGSPLIDQNHRVVGQLHGDPNYNSNIPYCDQRYGWYGKFSMSWNYGGSSATRLKDWLDPDNTGATVLNGKEGGMLTAGELPASAIWSGSNTLTGNITLPANVTLTLASGMTLNLNTHSIISTGGTIVDNGATINGLRATSKYFSSIKGLFPTIQSAVNNAGSFYTVNVESGTFNEYINVNNKLGLKIIGKGKSITRINGEITFANSDGAGVSHLTSYYIEFSNCSDITTLDHEIIDVGWLYCYHCVQADLSPTINNSEDGVGLLNYSTGCLIDY